MNKEIEFKFAGKTANDFEVVIDRNDKGNYSLNKIKIPYMGFRKLTAKQVKAILTALNEFPKRD